MKQEKAIKFEFQEIAIEEANELVRSKHGRFEELIRQLRERLPQLPPGRGFVFGSNGGTPLELKESNYLITVVNRELKTIGWRVSYSKAKKLFVCTVRKENGRAITRLPRGIPPAKRTGPPRGPTKGTLTKLSLIWSLREKGMKTSEIAKRVGLGEQSIYGFESRYRHLMEPKGEKHARS